jgi:hypothetical protein
MAGVVTSLEPNYIVGGLTEEINYFTLALIAPLSSYHNNVCHG